MIKDFNKKLTSKKVVKTLKIWFYKKNISKEKKWYYCLKINII